MIEGQSEARPGAPAVTIDLPPDGNPGAELQHIVQHWIARHRFLSKRIELGRFEQSSADEFSSPSHRTSFVPAWARNSRMDAWHPFNFTLAPAL
jgi:hypothetical protein